MGKRFMSKDLGNGLMGICGEKRLNRVGRLIGLNHKLIRVLRVLKGVIWVILF
jgi:hypothetical protein